MQRSFSNDLITDICSLTTNTGLTTLPVLEYTALQPTVPLVD